MQEIPKIARCLSCRWYRPTTEEREDYSVPATRDERGRLRRPWITVQKEFGQCLVNPPTPTKGRPVTHEDDVCAKWEPTPL